MRGPERVAHLLVVRRMLVGILDYESYGGTRCHTVEHSGEYPYPVFFVALSHDFALSGTAAVEFMLYSAGVDRYTCWHTVDDAAYGGAVRFAEGRESEYGSEAVHSCGCFMVRSATVALT